MLVDWLFKTRHLRSRMLALGLWYPDQSEVTWYLWCRFLNVTCHDCHNVEVVKRSHAQMTKDTLSRHARKSSSNITMRQKRQDGQVCNGVCATSASAVFWFYRSRSTSMYSMPPWALQVCCVCHWKKKVPLFAGPSCCSIRVEKKKERIKENTRGMNLHKHIIELLKAPSQNQETEKKRCDPPLPF